SAWRGKGRIQDRDRRSGRRDSADPLHPTAELALSRSPDRSGFRCSPRSAGSDGSSGRWADRLGNPQLFPSENHLKNGLRKEQSMTETKPWYLSRTIWASAVAVLTGVAGAAGSPFDAADGTLITDTLLQGVSAVAGLIAIIGRLSAKDRIG